MLYLNFLDRKKKTKFGGVVRFCTVTSTYETWHMRYPRFESLCERWPPMVSVRNIWFPCIHRILEKKGCRPSFLRAFFKAFKTYQSHALLEPNVWFWIIEQEKSVAVVQLYNSTMNLQYALYQSTYIPAKTEGIIVVQESRGSKQVGVVQLYFLTHKSSQSGRLPINSNEIFKKMYSLSTPHPKELVEEILYAMYLKIVKNSFKILKISKNKLFFAVRISKAALFYRRIYHPGLNSRPLT